MSVMIELADAVVASLNAAGLGQQLTAAREYVPAFELPELQTLRVSVVPKSSSISTATRDSSYFDCTLDIGVQKKVNVNDPAEIDALVDLTEAIIDHLRMRRLETMPQAVWLRMAQKPVFAPEHLDQQRVFTSVVSVTYRVRR